MVYFHCSISVCNSVDHPPTKIMANSVNSADFYPKPRLNNHLHRTKKAPNSTNCLKIPACHRSRSAAIDVLMLIAVIGACGFLLFPYIKFVAVKLTEVFGAIMYLLREEMGRAPLIYGSIALSISSAVLAVWAILVCTSRKCGNPNCKGLRKAAEFDIQLETEECVRNSNMKDGGVKRGLFELHRDHHRELEAELKKMAPPNGRAVLVFKARCGCSVGRLEVLGPKKQQRKIKK